MNGRLNEKKKRMVHVYDRDMEPLISLHSEIYYNVGSMKINAALSNINYHECP